MAQTLMSKLLLLVVFTLLLGCSSQDITEVNEVTAIEAFEMVKAENAVIIDVREQDEWDEEHIPGAILIPLGQIKARLAEIESYKGQHIVMQCRSDRRSALSTNMLLEAGFENVSNLTGGIIAWKKLNLPTEK